MSSGNVTIHQCPVCEAWQIDYTEAALLEAIGGYRPGVVGVNIARWIEASVRATMCAQAALLEDLILEHLRECFGVPS